MVAYCCVKGCTNNSSNKKKNPNDITSFHAFPSNVEMRQKWLRAIGRPDWVPPSYSRVCSSHFSFDQINHDGQRIRIKDDVVPIRDLPANSNFEASEVEVCRFCLAAEVKLYSLQDGVHRVYLDSVVGSNENYNIEGLPQFVCYECAAHLKKCYNLLERSLTVQATLLDIFAQYGKITTNHVNSKNRKELNLSSPLAIHETKTNYEFKCHQFDHEMNENEIEQKSNTDSYYISIPKLEVANLVMVPAEIDHCKENMVEEDFKMDDSQDLCDDDYNRPPDLNSDDELKPAIDDNVGLKEETKPKKMKKSSRSNSNEGLTPDEVDMQKHFNIVRLTLDQQLEEWRKPNEKKEYVGESFTCQTCSKVFANQNTYKIHTMSHDPELFRNFRVPNPHELKCLRTRGSAECPVCKLRFKSQTLARSHANRAHAKKFHCKLCTKAFNNVAVAKKHHKWHTGHIYSCPSCTFTSVHSSALGAHARAAHDGAHTCASCGRAFVSARGLQLHTKSVHHLDAESEENPKYRCQPCGLNFKSEGARRVHLLTSRQHKKKTTLCDPTPQDPSLKNTCKKCGVEFPSLKALIEHGRAEHRRPKHKTSWRLPDDSYPTPCEHCGILVSNRSEHWRHVRSVHPSARDSYRAVVTAVCHTCGKGFQNSTKLHLHTLRHGAPTVPCPTCALVFYDKYSLARHARVHAAARPHRCARCGQGFKQRSNRDRHNRVHTGVTPYECSMCGKKFKYSTSMNLHIRSVHYKLPLPPRKRKNKKLEQSEGYGK